MFAHVNDPRPLVSELRPELGTRFDAMLQRAMAIDPDYLEPYYNLGWL